MSLLKSLASDASIANEKDSLGGGGVLESGLYLAKVTLAYVTKSEGGALGLILQAKTEAGRDIRQTLWMTSGTAKGCKNYYEKDGEKNYLPGFIAANSLALLTTGKEISELDTEQKVVKVYNREAKAEMPTKVDMLVDLLDKDILIGVLKQTVDKTSKDASGAYQPTGETRDENEIDKFFRASDRMTTAEIRAHADKAEFADAWSAKNTGNTRNKASKTAGTAGVPKSGFGAAAANAGSIAKPSKSLFAA
jgi:hypothetical protein